MCLTPGYFYSIICVPQTGADEKGEGEDKADFSGAQVLSVWLQYTTLIPQLRYLSISSFPLPFIFSLMLLSLSTTAVVNTNDWFSLSPLLSLLLQLQHLQDACILYVTVSDCFSNSALVYVCLSVCVLYAFTVCDRPALVEKFEIVFFLHWIKVETQSYKIVFHTLQLRNNGKVILLWKLINL